MAKIMSDHTVMQTDNFASGRLGWIVVSASRGMLLRQGGWRTIWGLPLPQQVRFPTRDEAEEALASALLLESADA